MTRAMPHVTKERQARVLAYNTVANVTGLFVRGVIGFYLVRFLMAELGDTAYGVWVSVGGVFAYAGMLQMGLTSAVNWLVPHCLAANDRDGINRVVSTALGYYLLLGAVVLVATLILAWWFPVWFNVPEGLHRISIAVCLVVGISLSLRIPLGAIAAVATGLQAYVWTNAFWTLAQIARLALLVVLLSRGFGVLAVALVFVGTEFFRLAITSGLALWKIPGLRPLPRYFDLTTFKKMFAYGFNTMLYMLWGAILSGGTYALISILLGPAQVAWYVVPVTLVMTMSQFAMAMVRSLKPATASLHAQGEMSHVRLMFLRSQKYSVAVLVPMVAFLVVMGKPIIRLWIKDPAKTAMAPIVALLAIVYLFFLAQQSTGMILVGLGRHRLFGALTAISLAACVVLDIVFVKWFGLGLWGIALGTSIPLLVAGVLVLPLHGCRVLNVSIGRLIRDSWVRPMLVGVPVAVVTVAFYHCLYPSTWPLLLSEMAVVGFLAAVLNWFISLDGHERAFFLGLIRPKRQPVSSGRPPMDGGNTPARKR